MNKIIGQKLGRSVLWPKARVSEEDSLRQILANSRIPVLDVPSLNRMKAEEIAKHQKRYLRYAWWARAVDLSPHLIRLIYELSLLLSLLFGFYGILAMICSTDRIPGSLEEIPVGNFYFQLGLYLFFGAMLSFVSLASLCFVITEWLPRRIFFSYRKFAKDISQKRWKRVPIAEFENQKYPVIFSSGLSAQLKKVSLNRNGIKLEIECLDSYNFLYQSVDIPRTPCEGKFFVAWLTYRDCTYPVEIFPT